MDNAAPVVIDIGLSSRTKIKEAPDVDTTSGNFWINTKVIAAVVCSLIVGFPWICYLSNY